MRRLVEGDRSVVSRVFHELWPLVARYCERLLHDRADAEDAAQQALEKVFEQVDRYDPSRPALAWVLAVAGWECRTLLKMRLRRRQGSLDEARDIQDDKASPEDVVTQASLIAALRQVVATLSDSDRSTLEIAFAEALDEQRRGTTFRKRKERALVRLRNAFRRLYGS
jgi:RNA polymerase sigma factor (sigma-70 family)